jgi:hypothetical protein
MAIYESEGVRQPPQAGGKVREVAVRPGENGGHTVVCRYDNSMRGPDMPYQEDKEFPYGASEGSKVMEHVAREAGVKAKKPKAAKGKSEMEEPEEEETEE